MAISYCTVAEVKGAINFPTTGAPVSDSEIESFIEQSEEEIENIYKTKFGAIGDSGIADGDYSSTTLSQTGKTWTVDEWIGFIVWIYDGLGQGQYAEITSNTATKLTFAPAMTTVPDATSKYRITKLGYRSESVDGSGTKEQFVVYQPLINLIALEIDSIAVTPANVVQYKESGRLVLTSDSEVSWFADNNYQLVDMDYIYGVYPLPKIIKRLCICISGIRTLTAQIAGTYNDFTAVSLPGGLTASKGEPYVNIRSAVEQLQNEARGIVYGAGTGGQLGADFRVFSSYRPFTLFG